LGFVVPQQVTASRFHLIPVPWPPSMEQMRAIPFRSNRWKVVYFSTLAAVVLLIPTAWNVTRSTALVAARVAYSRGDLALCLQHSLDHLGRQPWSGEAALLAARCLSRLDYATEAEPYFLRAGRLTLNDLQIRAFGLARCSQPERSIPIYNEILATWPDNMTALRRLAAVQLAQSNQQDLNKLAEHFSRVSDGSAIGHMLRGVVNHRDNKPQQAVASFERVLELDPELREMPLSHRFFWTHLAEDLIASGRIDDAARVLIKAVAVGSDAELMNRLGEVYLLQGQLDDAERCFRQAVEWDPGHSKSYLNLSKVALTHHQSERALAYLNQAAQLAPLDNDVLSGVAAAYRQLGRTTDAVRAQEALARLPDKTARSGSGVIRSWPRHAL
jgi:tetratricopeptide (TPR) repeat protein